MSLKRNIDDWFLGYKTRAVKGQRRFCGSRVQRPQIGLQPSRQIENACLAVGIDELDTFQIAREIVDVGIL